VPEMIAIALKLLAPSQRSGRKAESGVRESRWDLRSRYQAHDGCRRQISAKLQSPWYGHLSTKKPYRGFRGKVTTHHRRAQRIVGYRKPELRTTFPPCPVDNEEKSNIIGIGTSKAGKKSLVEMNLLQRQRLQGFRAHVSDPYYHFSACRGGSIDRNFGVIVGSR
jgi:hypothetical protein